MSRKNFKSSFKKILEQAKNNALGSKVVKEPELKKDSITFDKEIETKDMEKENTFDTLGFENTPNTVEEIVPVNVVEEIKENSVISIGVTIKGDLESKGNLEIRGTVNGNILVEGKVEVMGIVNGDNKANSLHCKGGNITSETINVDSVVEVSEEGSINANCYTENMVIDGNYQGNATISGVCELRKNSVFNGDVVTPNISIEKGAKFYGVVKEN